MICGQRLIARILMSLALAPAGAAHAQYPNKPIKWIVPYPPGGITDNNLPHLSGLYVLADRRG